MEKQLVHWFGHTSPRSPGCFQSLCWNPVCPVHPQGDERGVLMGAACGHLLLGKPVIHVGALSSIIFPLCAVSVFLSEDPKLFICKCHLLVLQDVKVFSEDGTSKVVEILADMTARDLCQLLVYRSHCVDDNSWALVEHHPHLGLGGEQVWVGAALGGGQLQVGEQLQERGSSRKGQL